MTTSGASSRWRTPAVTAFAPASSLEMTTRSEAFAANSTKASVKASSLP